MCLLLQVASKATGDETEEQLAEAIVTESGQQYIPVQSSVLDVDRQVQLEVTLTLRLTSQAGGNETLSKPGWRYVGRFLKACYRDAICHVFCRCLESDQSVFAFVIMDHNATGRIQLVYCIYSTGGLGSRRSYHRTLQQRCHVQGASSSCARRTHRKPSHRRRRCRHRVIFAGSRANHSRDIPSV